MPRPVPSNNAVFKRVAGTNPAAGVEVTDAVPAGKFWELLTVQVPLVQGITQTPLPYLQITDPNDNVVAEFPGTSAAQGASTTANYTWGVDLPVTGQIGATPNIRSNGSLPAGLILPPGFKIKTVTQGIGANTDYGVPSYYVIEYG